MAKDNRIYIRMRHGGGFWVTKEEYEQSYADVKGVKTGQDEDEEKYSSIKNQIDRIQKRIAEFEDQEDLKPSQVTRILQKVESQLNAVQEAIRTEGENDTLLAYKKQLKQLKRGLINHG